MGLRNITGSAILLLVLLGSSSARELKDSEVYPYHYDVQLTIDVHNDLLSVEESIKLLIVEDTYELLIKNNHLNGSWLRSRLVNLETGLEYQPVEAIATVDEYTEDLNLQFEDLIPGGFNYTLRLTEISGSVHEAFNETHLDSKR